MGIFLDADGVLWPDKGPGGILAFHAQAVATIEEFTDFLGERSRYTIIVVTNQTLAARGEIGFLRFRRRVNRILKGLIDLQLIDHFEVCFHHPQAKNLLLRRKECACRKPAPGMILKGIEKFKLEPNRCVLVGDRITDISAGHAAGLAQTFLLYSGKALEINQSSKNVARIGEFLPFLMRRNLAATANFIKALTHD